MSQYSNGRIVFVGSHAGVSIGEDGSSQMALEDIAMMRAVHGMTVLYPCDGAAMNACVKLAYEAPGNVYIRATRGVTDVVYSKEEADAMTVGGSRVVRTSGQDTITLVSAGITLHECIAAAIELHKKGIEAGILDIYSVKPIDTEALTKALNQTRRLVVIEDHYPEGGLYEAVCGALAPRGLGGVVTSLAVNKLPRSATPAQLLSYEQIDCEAIVNHVMDALQR